MSRYIDADDVRAEIEVCIAKQEAIDSIDCLPSIDIVRCKECKHRYTPDCFRAYLEYDVQEWVVDSGDDDDFCSWGEKSTDE